MVATTAAGVLRGAPADDKGANGEGHVPDRRRSRGRSPLSAGPCPVEALGAALNRSRGPVPGRRTSGEVAPLRGRVGVSAGDAAGGAPLAPGAGLGGDVAAALKPATDRGLRRCFHAGADEHDVAHRRADGDQGVGDAERAEVGRLRRWRSQPCTRCGWCEWIPALFSRPPIGSSRVAISRPRVGRWSHRRDRRGSDRLPTLLPDRRSTPSSSDRLRPTSPTCRCFASSIAVSRPMRRSGR